MRQLMRMERIGQILEAEKRFRVREEGANDGTTFLQSHMKQMLLMQLKICGVAPAAAAARLQRIDAPDQVSE